MKPSFWLAALLTLSAAQAQSTLTLYSGRGESFVKPLVEQFTRNTGIRVNVRYGDTAALANLLQEEGARSPADIFWGQDAGAMGALSQAKLLAKLPDSMYRNMPDLYASSTKQWVATSGRARVLAYSIPRVKADELPKSVMELTQSKYKGKVAFPPTNGSFQSFVTAMRLMHGNAKTLEWLKGMKANEPKLVANNRAALQAIADGSADYALVNNYYLPGFLATDPKFPVAQAFFQKGDAGNLVNVAGAAILQSSRNKGNAQRFLQYLLNPASQQYFTSTVYEYPALNNVITNPRLTELKDVMNVAPRLDLDKLADLKGTLDLLRQAGLL